MQIYFFTALALSWTTCLAYIMPSQPPIRGCPSHVLLNSMLSPLCSAPRPRTLPDSSPSSLSSSTTDLFSEITKPTLSPVANVDFLTRARQQRRVRKSIEASIVDIRTTKERSDFTSPLFPLSSPNVETRTETPSIFSDFDFDEVHTEVNEDVKFIVRDYSSAVEREVRNCSATSCEFCSSNSRYFTQRF